MTIPWVCSPGMRCYSRNVEFSGFGPHLLAATSSVPSPTTFLWSRGDSLCQGTFLLLLGPQRGSVNFSGSLVLLIRIRDSSKALTNGSIVHLKDAFIRFIVQDLGCQARPAFA
jgi:hypothetical protein